MASREESSADDEREVFRTRLHPVMLGGAAGFAAFIALAGALIVLHNDLTPAGNGLVVLGTLAVAVAGMVPSWLRWRTSLFAVTDGRLRARVGLVPARRVEIPLGGIEGVDVEETFLGRRLGYGRVLVAGRDGTIETFAPVASAAELRAALLTAAGRGGRRR